MPGRDCLAGAGIGSQDEPERLASEHRLGDGRDLAGQRSDVRGLDRHHRVQQERQKVDLLE
jgi:hypothetical protein